MSSHSHTEIRRTPGRLVTKNKEKARKLTSENSNRQENTTKIMERETQSNKSVICNDPG
jgi:hypothetical protein